MGLVSCQLFSPPTVTEYHKMSSTTHIPEVRQSTSSSHRHQLLAQIIMPLNNQCGIGALLADRTLNTLVLSTILPITKTLAIACAIKNVRRIRAIFPSSSHSELTACYTRTIRQPTHRWRECVTGRRGYVIKDKILVLNIWTQQLLNKIHKNFAIG